MLCAHLTENGLWEIKWATNKSTSKTTESRINCTLWPPLIYMNCFGDTESNCYKIIVIWQLTYFPGVVGGEKKSKRNNWSARGSTTQREREIERKLLPLTTMIKLIEAYS